MSAINSLCSISSTSPLVLSVYQSRVSVISTEINYPVALALRANSLVLAIVSAGGCMERSPFLRYYDSEGFAYEDFPDEEEVEVSLTEVADCVTWSRGGSCFG